MKTFCTNFCKCGSNQTHWWNKLIFQNHASGLTSHPVDTSADSVCIHRLVFWNSLLVVKLEHFCLPLGHHYLRQHGSMNVTWHAGWTVMLAIYVYTGSLGMRQACWCSEFCAGFFLKAILAQWRWHKQWRPIGKSVHSSTIRVCFGICLGQCTTVITMVTM